MRKGEKLYPKLSASPFRGAARSRRKRVSPTAISFSPHEVNLLEINSAICGFIFIPFTKQEEEIIYGDTNEFSYLGRQSQGRKRDDESGARGL
jgi:hypothetical protein